MKEIKKNEVTTHGVSKDYVDQNIDILTKNLNLILSLNVGIVVVLFIGLISILMSSYSIVQESNYFKVDAYRQLKYTQSPHSDLSSPTFKVIPDKSTDYDLNNNFDWSPYINW